MKNHTVHAAECAVIRETLKEKAQEIYKRKVSKIPFDDRAASDAAFSELAHHFWLANEWYADNIHADAFSRLATPIPTFGE